MAVETDVSYIVVVFGSGPFYCVSPDFTIMAEGVDSASAVNSVQKLMEESIGLSKSLGKEAPTPTPRSILEREWNSPDNELLSVVVRV